MKIAKKDILENVMDFKFMLILLLSIITFSSSAIVQSMRYLDRVGSSAYFGNNEQVKIKEKSGSLSALLNHNQVVFLPPNPLEFAVSGNYSSLPDRVAVSPLQFRVDSINVENGQANPLGDTPLDFDWTFIIGIVLSFGAIVFTYDSISGEKEKGTLRIIFANTVDKYRFLLGKFTGSFLTLCIPLVFGVVINLLVVTVYFKLPLSPGHYMGILIILFTASIYLSFFISLGLAVSSLVDRSMKSLAVLFFAWVFLVLLIPSTSGIFGNLLHPVMNSTNLKQIQDKAVQDIREKYKETYGRVDFSKPFSKETILWVKATNETIDAVQKVKNNHLTDLMAQAQFARNFSFISPFSIFKYSTENISDSGFPRVRSFLKGAQRYRQDLLEFLIREDKKDPQSPHLLFSHFFSRKPVDFNNIPRFTPGKSSLSETLPRSFIYILFLTVYALIAFAAAFTAIIQYDVR